MPELSGPELYRELERRHPALARRFVFVTGDTLSKDAADFAERASAPTLSKPFVPDEVRRVVHRVAGT